MLLHLAETNEVVEDGGGVLAVLELVLALVQVRLERLQLGKLLGDIGFLFLRFKALGLDLTSGTATLRSVLEHVEADTVLHYKVR